MPVLTTNLQRSQQQRHISPPSATTYPLRVHLIDIRQPLREHIAWHLVSVLVPELRSLGPSPRDGRTSIRDRTGHYAADTRGEVENVGYRRGIEELVLIRHHQLKAYGDFLLRDDDGTVLSAESDGCDIRRGDSLERIFCSPPVPISVPLAPSLLPRSPRPLPPPGTYRLDTTFPDQKRS
jgi:hypothetical protein